MEDSDAILPEPKSFVRENLLWIAGFLPFLMAAYQLLRVSAGDQTVMAYLINNLDIVKFTLALVVPFVPVAGFWVCVAWLQARARLPEPQKSQLEWSLLTTNILIAGLVLAMTVTTFVINVVLMYGAFLIRRWFHDRKLRKEDRFAQENRIQTRPMVLATILALNSILVATTVSWLPPEIISVKNQSNVTARVIAADGNWTTYLDSDHAVRITPTADIQSRMPCSTATSFTSKSIGAAIASMFGKDKITPVACPTDN